MLPVIFLLLQACPFVYGAENPSPLWATLLHHNKQWEGICSYDSIIEVCSLTVHSAASASFTSDHMNMDMKVSSDDNVTVTFEESSVWDSSAHAAGHTNLQLMGVFTKQKGVYHFVGNISSLEQKNFGSVNLSPKTYLGRSNDDTSLRYGLAIGIPVVLAILLMIASVLILRWGIKKGYLRHVPWAYKHFTNPRRGQPDFELDNSKQNVGTEQPEVHI
ncbi:hypothetical protein BsWGS_03946 [Bradybaena similaris]